MIVFKGSRTDYAIMKQIQQIRIARAGISESTVELTGATDFSGLRNGEALAIVSHGNPQTGDLGSVDTATLLGWLTDQARGLRASYKGTISIFSCYSGQKVSGQTSLAERVAAGLKGKVAHGAKVEGANGYSFGTPEFSSTGRSSVLSTNLSEFYFLDGDRDRMRAKWLTHKPTHRKGVLQVKFGNDVRTSLTIRENIQKAIDTGRLPTTVDAVATDCITVFADAAQQIEQSMKGIVAGSTMPGSTVVDRIDHMLTNTNDQQVVAWNNAIARQYELFTVNYLWMRTTQAFTEVDV